MTKKQNIQKIQGILAEINTLKKRIANYDWEYRLNRFDEKIQFEHKEVTDRLKKFMSSD